MTTRTCCRCGERLASLRQKLCLACRDKPREGGPLAFRERQVIALVAASKSNQEIADALGLTVGTVKEYMHRIMRKIGAKNRTDVAVRMMRGTLE